MGEKLLSVQNVSEMLGVSPRHIRRLNDAGRMPAPVRLGKSVRWPESALTEWVKAGCPDCRKWRAAS